LPSGDVACYWWHDPLNKDWGALYNWFAVNSGKLAPIGWHIPTKEEWETLIAYLGTNSGHKLKIVGDLHWVTEVFSHTEKLPEGNTVDVTSIVNPSGTVTYSIPSGFSFYHWSVMGGNLTELIPTVISGGGENDNFIEVQLYPPNISRVLVDYEDNGVLSSVMWSQITRENSESTNESGFSAIPNGYKRFCGTIFYHGINAYYWADDLETGDSNYLILPSNNYLAENNPVIIKAKWDFAPSHFQTYAFSVRCIKD